MRDLRRGMRRAGRIIQANSISMLLATTISLLLLCSALKSYKLDVKLSSWIQRSSQVEFELNYAHSTRVSDPESASASGREFADELSATNALLLGQTAASTRAHQQNSINGNNNDNNLLTVDALMVHLEALAIATQLHVDAYDVTWSLKDLCFRPTLPDYEGAHISIMLDNIMPCAIRTPLDCFWEGAKLLGPEHPVSLSPFKAKLKWTSLNPQQLVEEMMHFNPHASFPYKSLLDWMRRVGISSGYQQKPCLLPQDPNCPITAPNKASGLPPNVGQHLTGGCTGLAANQMLWREEEIIGGTMRNRSTGQIIRASALQSIIPLMSEQDVYDYWRKTSKVQDVNNWSLDKAKLVLELWQRRFREELAQFTRSSASSAYKISAITPKLMAEPIDSSKLLDLTNFQYCFIIMTILSCIAFPHVRLHRRDARCQRLDEDLVKISWPKTMVLTIATASFIGLTFVASLGLSSFVNLPINMATTQILPPLALLYGFHQFILIANTYARKLEQQVPKSELTSECFDELLPTILLETLMTIIALFAAAIVPVTATRVFSFQAIIFVSLTSLSAIVLIPALVTILLIHYMPDSDDCTPARVTVRKRKGTKTCIEEINIEDQILSRIHDDLKNIRADRHRPSTDINISAHLAVDGLHTSFEVRGLNMKQNVKSAPTNSFPSELPPKYDEVPQTLKPGNSIPSHPIPPKDGCKLTKFQDPGTIPTSERGNLDQGKKLSEDREEIASKKSTCHRILRVMLSNRFSQVVLFTLGLCLLIAIVILSPPVKYGIHLKDIIARDSEEYSSFALQDKYFPIYNIHLVTKGNFDYPTNQKQLHELFDSVLKIDGVIGQGSGIKAQFWLDHFKDWLLEIQDRFDFERNKSTITNDGWTQDSSDAAKLAYKLLSQTGKLDNPVDKSLVETNRLVSADGIINPKAFYHYLSAWVANDAFTYANTEAYLKPEPKNWNDNQDDLKVEKARPLIYAQMPFLLKLSGEDDIPRKISEIRSISQAFEHLNVPNFPLGIPFIFWDQFLSIDYLFYLAIAICMTADLFLVGLIFSDLSKAVISTIPIFITILETYYLLGVLSTPFNNILAILMISTTGLLAVQAFELLQLLSSFDKRAMNHGQTVSSQTRMNLTNLSLILTFAIIFNISSYDFMTRYSRAFLTLAVLNLLNSILFMPILLAILQLCPTIPNLRVESKSRGVVVTGRTPQDSGMIKNGTRKKRGYPRFQSEISLSTISEESQAEAHIQDLKFDFSIRCY